MNDLAKKTFQKSLDIYPGSGNARRRLEALDDHHLMEPKLMKLPLLLLFLATLGACQPTPADIPRNAAGERWFFWSADWHPSQEQLVVGGSNDTFLKILSTEDFRELKTLPYPGTITQTKWHPTENRIAIAVQDGKSKCALLEVDTGKLTELDSITPFGARALGWNRTGDLLAVGDYEGMLTLFDAAGSFLRRIDLEQKSIIGLDWHPQENRLVAVGDRIALYDFATDRVQHIEDRPEDVLMLCVAWHPDGSFFVTGDYGDFEVHHPPLLQYWTADGERIRAIEESKAEYRNIAWSPDGTMLATASEQLRLWDRDGELLAAAPSENLLWGIDWRRDGERLVTTDDGGTIVVWDRKLNPALDVAY